MDYNFQQRGDSYNDEPWNMRSPPMYYIWKYRLPGAEDLCIAITVSSQVR